jgi:hypothetical protein
MSKPAGTAVMRGGASWSAAAAGIQRCRSAQSWRQGWIRSFTDAYVAGDKAYDAAPLVQLLENNRSAPASVLVWLA